MAHDPDAGATLDALAHDPEHADRIVYDTVIPARPARTATLATPLGDALTERAVTRGLEALWTHQAAAKIGRAHV